MSDFIKNKYKGCLIGLACGDYLGLPFEFSNSKQVRAFFNDNKISVIPKTSSTNPSKIPGYYTDDTSQALCLAQSLIDNNGFNAKDQMDKYRKWFLEGYMTPYDDRQFGIGQYTFSVLCNDKNTGIPDKIFTEEKAGGNGALMRCAPIGLFYKDIEDIKEYSIKSAIVTHNNKESAWSCVVQNMFIRYALNKIDKKQFQKKIIEDISDISELIKELILIDYSKITLKEYNSFPITGYTINTLRIALYSFFTSDSFEEAINKSIMIGGDTDTQAAVTGALAGVYYGYDNIPKEWRETLIQAKRIEEIALLLM
jgi:ADP-ribosyl-[dinitrogen reductase] hydrolase